jgi:AcrR family transcriptional regulator
LEHTKKECILLEAARAFARFGFKKASIDEIAKEAGVGKGTVYLAAESKEDLFYQVLHREMRAWQAECARAIDPRIPADQLLTKLLTTATTYLEKHPLVRDLLFGETARTLPSWRERFDELRASGRTNVAEVLRIGMRQGLFRDDLDVDAIAGVLQDFHYSALHTYDPKDADFARRASVGVDLVLNGLRTRKHAHERAHDKADKAHAHAR